MAVPEWVVDVPRLVVAVYLSFIIVFSFCLFFTLNLDLVEMLAHCFFFHFSTVFEHSDMLAAALNRDAPRK